MSGLFGTDPCDDEDAPGSMTKGGSVDPEIFLSRGSLLRPE